MPKQRKTKGRPKWYFTAKEIREVEGLASVLSKVQVAWYYGIGQRTAGQMLPGPTETFCGLLPGEGSCDRQRRSGRRRPGARWVRVGQPFLHEDASGLEREAPDRA